MNSISNLFAQLSQSFLGKSFNYILEFFKPVRYLIDDVFQFIFGKVRARNSRRLLFCIGFCMLFYKLGNFLYRTLPIVTKLAIHNYHRATFMRMKFKERYGANCWALVTGFTQGIGFAFAQQLARLKYNLVLIGRNKTKIEYALRWIRQIHPSIEVKVIQLDFNIAPQKLYNEVYHKTTDLDIGILVNNVGTAYGGMFVDIERKKLTDNFDINVNSMVELNKIFISRFKQRVNRSAIVNLSSCTGVFPSPRVGLYSFTKVYLDVFSRIITEQCKHSGIDVLTYRPFGVSTPMMAMKKGPLMISPRECAQTALFELGHQKESFGGFKHKLSGIIFSNMSQQARFDKYNSGFKVVQDNIQKSR